jgi:hypothetical protein
MDTPTLVGTGFVILAGFVWIFCAILAYQTAPKFGRRNVTWGILGIIFGPIALMALYIMPHGHLEHAGGSKKKQDPYAAKYEVPKKKR